MMGHDVEMEPASFPKRLEASLVSKINFDGLLPRWSEVDPPIQTCKDET